MKTIKAQTQKQKILSLLNTQGLLRPRDLAIHNISREVLNRLVKSGKVERISHGLYRLANAGISENQTIMEVSKAIPSGIVCLLSALRFHKLTTQNPAQVWLAISSKAHSSAKMLPVRFVRFSGPAFAEGIEQHTLEGTPVKVYSPAKTVADCFKYRNKIGLDVAIEALKECRSKNLATIDQLWHYAKICRVGNIIRPYLEAVTI